MASASKAALAVAVTAILAACGASLPAPDSIELTPVPGVALPHKARVMIYMSESDQTRKMSIQSSRYRSTETDIKEGLLLVNATRTLLGKGFSQVEVNAPSSRPQIVVKPGGKANWSVLDTKAKIGCSLDAYTADGIPIGNFVNRYTMPGETDYRDSLEAAYAQCLIKPMEDLLASPALARLAGAGFRDPPPVAVEAWLRSLGPMPERR